MPDGSIRVEGGHPLGPVRYCLHADRIVTGTYLLAAEATGGRIRIRNAPASQQQALLQVLGQMGATVQADTAGIALQAGDQIGRVSYLETAPYPGFPTDLQSPLMASLCRAGGDSRICERMFENRFRTAAELAKLGAQICCEGNIARITGVDALHPAALRAPDLRGGAALVIAALQTEGRTRIGGTEFIERGYEDICRDLQALGATIEKLE
jgi:UDP-N-acetylglucosamine 1-carboxyvinyltransferase